MRVGDSPYLGWLYGKVADPDNLDPSYSWWLLIEFLARKEFVPGCADDENRRDAVSELRWQARGQGILSHWREPTWLEVLLELAGHADFLAAGTDAEQSMAGWFWEFLGNAGLDCMNDENWDEAYAESCLSAVLCGDASFFWSAQNSSESLWSKLGDYILDRTDLI